WANRNGNFNEVQALAGNCCVLRSVVYKMKIYDTSKPNK
ncbi:unnamed protein product, partial [Rotaria socialis]